MRLSTTRYATMLVIQSKLLVLDIILNGISEFLSRENIVLLVVFILQDVCIIVSIILVFLSFFSTYVFEAGLVGILVRRFGVAVFVCFCYLGLSLSLHTWTLSDRWDLHYGLMSSASHAGGQLTWPRGLGLLYAAQRTWSALYYHAYKRAMLRIADPRYYEDVEWIKMQALATQSTTQLLQE